MAQVLDSRGIAEGVAEGEPSATPRIGLDHWAHEYGDDLRRFLAARRIVESDIKDICQEVFLRLLRFDRGEVIQNPCAYLFRIAANVAHDFRLRQTKRIAVESQPEDETAPGPDELVEASRRQRCLMQALGELPPVSRAALTLQAQHDLTYDEIAAQLGTSRRAVKRAVVRGHALLREKLTRELG